MSCKQKFLYALIISTGSWFLVPDSSFAFTYNRHGVGLRLNGYGTGGMALPESVLYDYRVRGQANYAVRNGWTLGGVYSMDRQADQFDRFYSDAFIFTESPYGRAEIGWTESVAAKLGVGLPDVGALRINNSPLVYGITDTHGIISNPGITGTRYAFRASTVSVPTRPFQFGASVAPFDARFNSATDFGVRYRQPHGRTKYALTLGAGFIDNPRELNADLYAPRVTAESRSQVAFGGNVQHRSWQIGATVRGIYDKDAVGPPTDGLQTGVGASYDFLQWSASGTYILSAVGIWDNNDAFPHSTITHTGVASLRYKIDQHFELFGSTGVVAQSGDVQPFIAAGIHAKF
jgi:hypothetical protein